MESMMISSAENFITKSGYGLALVLLLLLAGCHNRSQSANQFVVMVPDGASFRSAGTSLRHFYRFDQPHGFPSTGFHLARFQLVVKNNHDEHQLGQKVSDNNRHYHWSSSLPDFATVTEEGVVTLNHPDKLTPPPAQLITITAIDKNQPQNRFDYTFKLKKWFIHNSDKVVTWKQAHDYCSGQDVYPGYRMPADYAVKASGQNSFINARPELANTDYKSQRQAGNAWGEWGDLTIYNVGWLKPTWGGYWAGRVSDKSAPQEAVYFLVNVEYGFVNWRFLNDPAESHYDAFRFGVNYFTACVLDL